jgi:uncharacterized protein
MIHALLLTIALVAARYPQATDPHVNDFASVISSKDAERIRGTAQATLRDHGVAIVVATITSLGDYDAADLTIERYAADLYNQWGIGDRSTNKGVLLLVSVRDRKLRIATGTGLGNRDGEARQVIDSVIVPRFKSADMSGGIAAGVDAIAKWFQPARTGSGGSQSPNFVPVENAPGGEGVGWTPHGSPVRNASRGGCGCFTWLILIFVIFSVISAIGRRGRGYPVAGGGGYGSGGGFFGGGGWWRFLLGSLTGFLGSQMLRPRGSQWGGWNGGAGSRGDSGGGFFGSSGDWGGGSGGGSSFGGGSSSGGGASGSW